ncbi:hypothetical protein Ae201684P_018409 [Aphanomyces euteiches]|uniref:Uncharacterized protein n=1 Tax=Aphanomyces euteiches TaxID=100861 RepID=A0A6G0WG25_9STRA|nr:hypothetical protein Ae201684_015749 [Aphanomyces euteiches]KAH9099393.1 hypothetical protein Ae201684P_018409 [Aphanomyces euteiches]KAH9157935.1 hypothetical protein AeRB84_000254 [Aphanomyces euteiches]
MSFVADLNWILRQTAWLHIPIAFKSSSLFPFKIMRVFIPLAICVAFASAYDLNNASPAIHHGKRSALNRFLQTAEHRYAKKGKRAGEVTGMFAGGAAGVGAAAATGGLGAAATPYFVDKAKGWLGRAGEKLGAKAGLRYDASRTIGGKFSKFIDGARRVKNGVKGVVNKVKGAFSRRRG